MPLNRDVVSLCVSTERRGDGMAAIARLYEDHPRWIGRKASGQQRLHLPQLKAIDTAQVPHTEASFCNSCRSLNSTNRAGAH